MEIAPEAEAELIAVAAKVFWWGTPKEKLDDLGRFVAQVMVYGDWQDVQKTMHLLGKHTFVSVLDTPPAGIFDKKSWNYWHLYFGRDPVPPLPQRQL
jgi:hypothetical protein